jgi:hypothetical protein
MGGKERFVLVTFLFKIIRRLQIVGYGIEIQY